MELVEASVVEIPVEQRKKLFDKANQSKTEIPNEKEKPYYIIARFGGDTVFREAIATGETVEQGNSKCMFRIRIESCGDNFEVIEMPTKKTLGILVKSC